MVRTVKIWANIHVSSKFVFDYSTFWKSSGIFGTLSIIGPIFFNTHFDLLKAWFLKISVAYFPSKNRLRDTSEIMQ